MSSHLSFLESTHPGLGPVGTSRVWLAEIGAMDEAACLEWLHPGDHVRLQVSMHPAVRKSFLASRSLLRRLIFACTGSSPGDQHFEFNRQGKPFLRERPDLHFNISHSLPWVMVALSRDPIGVDVERMRPRSSLLALAERYFSPPEQELIHAAPDPVEMFYRIWTFKEAWLKAEGLGITVELSSWDTRQYWDAGQPHPSGWKFHPAMDGERSRNHAVMAAVVSQDPALEVSWCI